MKNRIFKEWELSLLGAVIIIASIYAFVVEKMINATELGILITTGLGAIGASKSDFKPKNDK